MAVRGFFRTLFSYLCFLVKWTVQLIVLRILGVVSPDRQREILVRVAKATQFWDCPLEFDDYAGTFLSLSAYLDVCGAVWRDVSSYVMVGSPAPRCDVIELDTGRTRDLLEFGNPVDTMDNNVAKTYACYPDRLFVILDGRVVYKGGLGPEGYHLDEVRDWLQNFTGKDRQR
ncbi:PREDICTED: uncharacterized protein LOC109476824 [Branchiostoma belcheri]|uniref:Iodothyronine deiodinase n=1 Tax=Branchiostoma belcheri TaxID=7741 RepID=A0A6P4ZR36_BRABE|nr:PREDICTED: uncharacterized protein LOC109476824 [Branchiostoma belcheri]